MDDNCGEWVESMGVVVRSYIDFLILLIPTPLVFVHLKKCFLFFIIESTDSISRDERDVPLTQYITNA